MDALILAGGENKRLPVLKGFLEVNGKRIIESNIELLSRIFDRVIISTDKPELYFPFGVLMLGDIIKYRGPMIGIFSALTVPEISEIFVTACDMPFIKPELIRYIVDKYNTQNIVPPTHPSSSPCAVSFTTTRGEGGDGKGRGENMGREPWALGSYQKWDAAIPSFAKRPQPLLGIYSKRIVGDMEKIIKQGKRSLREFLHKINVLYIEEEEVRSIDMEGRSFVNINTMEDFQKEIGGEICLV